MVLVTRSPSRPLLSWALASLVSSRYSGNPLRIEAALPIQTGVAFHAFHFFGGIFRTLIYDNLSTAVEKILKGKDRREQKEFIKFRAHYNFEARFCNPASGHVCIFVFYRKR